jgi:hypothetical protein
VAYFSWQANVQTLFQYTHCRPSDSLTPCSLVIPFHLLLLFIRRRCPQSSTHVSPHGAVSSSFQTEMKCYSLPVTRSNHINPRKQQALSAETVVTSNSLSNVSSDAVPNGYCVYVQHCKFISKPTLWQRTRNWRNRHLTQKGRHLATSGSHIYHSVGHSKHLSFPHLCFSCEPHKQQWLY